MDVIKIEINGKEISFPVIKGSENEHGINITKLRHETGFITLVTLEVSISELRRS